MIDKKEQMIQHMEGVSFVLGKAHAGLHELLQAPDSELRERLRWLFDKITEDVNKLYYS